MKELKLCNSDKVSLVDDEDYDRLIQHKWRLSQDRKCKSYYTVKSTIGRRNFFLHRYILDLPKHKKGDPVVDHIDRNTLNNQKSNLRLVSQQTNVLNSDRYENTLNIITVRQKPSGNYVVYHKEDYHGCYASEEDALLVRDKLLLSLNEDLSLLTYNPDVVMSKSMPEKLKQGKAGGQASAAKHKGIQRPDKWLYKRPEPKELHKLVWSMTTKTLAAQIGCSDKAIEKWCRAYNIPKPPKGFWAKVTANKLDGLSCPIIKGCD